MALAAARVISVTAINVFATAAMHFPTGQPSPPPSAPVQPYALTMSAGHPMTGATSNGLLADKAGLPGSGDRLVTAVLVPPHEFIGSPADVSPHAIDALPRDSVVVRAVVPAVATSGHRQVDDVADQVHALVAVYIGPRGGGPV